MKSYSKSKYSLFNRPLLITESGFQTFVDNLENPMEDENEMFDINKENKVAFVNIHGALGKNLGFIERIFGLTDINDINDSLDIIETYPDMEGGTIVFDINSPGGNVDGIPELADRIGRLSTQFHTIALIDGMCCSAAYYLASGCNEIVAVGKTSTIGSIGVYVYAENYARMYANAGVDPMLIKSGKNKAEGIDTMPFSQEFKDDLQTEVDYIHNLFKEHVKQYRPVEDSDMEGKSYMTEFAIGKNLVDYMINDKKDLFLD